MAVVSGRDRGTDAAAVVGLAASLLASPYCTERTSFMRIVRVPPLSVLRVICDGVLAVTVPVTVDPSRMKIVACCAFASGAASLESFCAHPTRSNTDNAAEAIHIL